uniref:Uncharacterized protein n=1 Tax=Myotis myotis TaxID=51298 RepID=A0A7J7UPS2_MYOMY|nr:hypothetical protein mMyoMyo1_008650 [Myotis myotis]
MSKYVNEQAATSPDSSHSTLSCLTQIPGSSRPAPSGPTPLSQLHSLHRAKAAWVYMLEDWCISTCQTWIPTGGPFVGVAGGRSVLRTRRRQIRALAPANLGSPWEGCLWAWPLADQCISTCQPRIPSGGPFVGVAGEGSLWSRPPILGRIPYGPPAARVADRRPGWQWGRRDGAVPPCLQAICKLTASQDGGQQPGSLN